jgi:hypothetical protein
VRALKTRQTVSTENVSRNKHIYSHSRDANGQLPAEKVGGRWLIKRSQARAFAKLPPGVAGQPRRLES